MIPGPVLQRIPALARSLRKAPPLPEWYNPAFDKSRAELEQMIAKWTKDYVAEGAPIQGKLEAFTPVPVNLKRGRCYRMAFRLEDGAQFSEWAKRGIAFKYLKIDGIEVNGGPGIAGPGGVGSAGCVSRDATPNFDVWAIWRSALDLSRIHDLGHGRFTAQLYGKPASSAH